MAALRTAGAVKSLVYDSVFKRAQEIAASDRIRLVAFEGEGLLKGMAECIGSSPSDVYKLSVSIDGTSAVGDCSCPAGKSAKSGLCKHAVALLLRRVKEIQETKPSLFGTPPEEVVISIASQVDDIHAMQDERNSGDEGEAMQSISLPTVAQRNGPASSSKRGLPAWILGIVGSDVGSVQSSNKAKSSKRVVEPKLSRPPPPPAKRARRSGHPLKILNDSDKEEEDPGEVHDAGPLEKNPAPEVSEEDKLPEIVDPPTGAAAARERRRLRGLKKEAVVAADNKHNEQVKGRRGQSSKAFPKDVSEQPVRASNRRRLAKKYVVEEDSDGPAEVDGDASNGYMLTDEELLFLAQEQLERKKGTEQPEDLGPAAHVDPAKEEEQPDASQGKKSSSIFSMSRWKEVTSDGKDNGGALSLDTDDVDLETLRSASLAAISQSASQSDTLPWNAEDAAAEAAIESPIPTSTEIGNGDSDAATNMLSIFFGSSITQVPPKKVPAANSTPNAYQDKPNFSAAEVGFEVPKTSSCEREDAGVAPTGLVARADTAESGGEYKSKKKSSLKDRVKVLLS